jgi:threonylcarbamoyladenosine tRNA methylthiotransferase MtaB
VRRAREKNPNAIIAVAGCFSQISPDEAEGLDADIIFGSSDRRGLVREIEKMLVSRKRERVMSVSVNSVSREFEPLPPSGAEDRTRAMLKIEDGCDNFCAYCVIPLARGRVRSLPLSEIAAMSDDLARRGYREIVITGIEIASYGKDLGRDTGLIDAVLAAARAAPGTRIRLGSLEPTVIANDFCARLAGAENICPHFHLSLQSGCDKTLEAMRRKYGTARFAESAALLRKYFPGCALVADLIVGFPGESGEDFSDTLEFIRKCEFSSMHIFPYSKRPGTASVKMPGHLPNSIKEGRAKWARELADAMRDRYLDGQLGKILPVLFETDGADGACGHADNYCPVRARGENLRGLVKNVLIEDVSGQMLVGNII